MLRAVLLSLAFALSVFGGNGAFVKPGDFWRVIPYTNNAPEPKANWPDIEYDDSSWPLLRSSFVRSGIGTPGTAEQTFLPGNSNTFCFRKTFEVADPAFVEWLSLRIDYESGMVAYLNGAEVARRSFPTNTAPVPLGVPAAAFHARGATEIIDLSIHKEKLRSGKNVLAVQLHSAADKPGLLLVAELVANFARGPLIQNTTTNSTQIIWHTSPITTGFVAYGKDAEHLFVVRSDVAATNHAVTIPALEPGQTYIYRVYAEEGTQVAASDWHSFTTFKMPGNPITFFVIGDTGQASTAQHKIAEQMRAHGADLVMHVGDVLYPCFTAAAADARCFSIYREQMHTTPFFVAMGNHDGYCGATDYFNAFYFPTNSATGTEHYYSFDHGDAHFIALATETPIGNRYDPESQQYKWLEADLAATKQHWKFIFFHHVIRSSSLHSYDDYFPFNGWDKLELQAYIGGLASKYGAQVIFNGHDHNYERFAASDGVNSFVTGGGGASLYSQAIQEEGSVQFHARHNFLKVTLNETEMNVQAIDDNGAVFDRFYRSRVGSGSGVVPSTWGSPVVEDARGADAAGNIPGQIFNFTGEAIRTRAGVHANLGLMHVRNDRKFLYVGFESASIWRNQAVALFVENPNQPGITDLAPLGNGIIENESGEGADGLDMLDKLRFRNFRPSVGCLLGDEHADGNERTFQRLYMRWPVGQGVFHLDQNFSSIPDARLQQFDRSPQTGVPFFFNSDADFIEVAIPLHQLGNPQTGAARQVKLGAIAFSDPATGPLIAEIDTAFAGNALDAGVEGELTLEPITIQLAPDPDPFQDGFGFSASLLTDTTLRFEWNSALGATYSIQAAQALGMQFGDVNAAGLPVTATSNRTIVDLQIDGASPRFYRLRAH